MTVLDGSSLTVDEVLRLGAQKRPRVIVDDRARESVAASWTMAEQVAARRPIYGRTTGVGANRDTEIEQGAASDLRLLRSHSTGSGPILDETTTRMALLIRLNQLLRGGSGIHPDVIDALQSALVENQVPRIRAVGGIGTADLNGLAEIALSMIDDGRWNVHPGDALPFLSSSAVTLASACAAIGRLRRHLEQTAFVAALSFLGVRASRESLQPAVQAARPHAGQIAAADTIRELLDAYDVASFRVQDSYGFRAYPQITGALIDAASALEQIVGVEIVSAAENPLFDFAARDAFHNANFHGIHLALAVDHAKLALASAGQLSVARLTDLSSPDMTGLGSFLASGAPGSSGIMLLEYNQAAAQAELRQAAQPATLGSIVISRGVENHSSFSTQAVGQLHRALDAAFDILACELVAAARALDLHGDKLPPGGPLAGFLDRYAPLVDHDLADRSLTADLAAARAFLATA
jgi:histidine ammonia-lyase